MKASVLVGPMKSEVQDVPVPEIGDDDVLMRVQYVGACASEIHPWQHGTGGLKGVLGHEPLGYAEKVGKNVAHIREGDRITAIGQGCFAEFARIPARLAIPVPEGIRDEEALGEPLSCLISAAERTPVRLGDCCAIVGLGYMGLGMMRLIKLKGATRIVAIDVRRACESDALEHGAVVFFTPDEVPEQMKLTEWSDLGRGYGVDIACECGGKAPALKLAGEMVREHGVLNIVGYHQGAPVLVDMELWNWKAITVINGHERREAYQAECMERGLRMIEMGALCLDRLVTHVFALDQVDGAFQAILEKPTGHIKGIIRL